ncbi:type II toxin-antitoxin system RelE/ParE family toxin [Nioella sediminis]|uniref:type II toxin-antitoxin system RelE/ParE family toxin n=1 Tax=Nioella sediminis TaxID=1912092 RepID=UPI000ACBEDD2
MPDLSLDILPQADADLEDIWPHTAHAWSIAHADHYIVTLYGSSEMLCDLPTVARERPEITPPARVHPIG